MKNYMVTHTFKSKEAKAKMMEIRTTLEARRGTTSGT